MTLLVKFKSLTAAERVRSPVLIPVIPFNDKSTEFNWANLFNKLVVVARETSRLDKRREVVDGTFVSLFARRMSVSTGVVGGTSRRI